MGYLEKEKTLIKRDGEGKLIAVDVTLELLSDKPVMRMTPLTKGDLQQLLNDPDSEEEVVRKHLIEPAYEAEEFKFVQPQTYGAMKMALLALSTDSSQEDLQKSTVESVLENAKKKPTSPKGD